MKHERDVSWLLQPAVLIQTDAYLTSFNPTCWRCKSAVGLSLLQPERVETPRKVQPFLFKNHLLKHYGIAGDVGLDRITVVSGTLNCKDIWSDVSLINDLTKKLTSQKYTQLMNT